MATKKGMTPWFPAHIKPVRVGVYEVRLVFTPSDFDDGYAYYDGEKWSCMVCDFSDVERAGFWGAEQKKAWRGFTQDMSK